MNITTYWQLDTYKIWKSTFNFSCKGVGWKEYSFNCIKTKGWYIAESADILPRSWANSSREFKLKDKAIEYLKSLMKEVGFKESVNLEDVSSTITFEANSSSMFDRSYSTNNTINNKIVNI